MIIWLASYPRSGNTMLRILLHRVFGVNTYSKYDDHGDIGSNEGLSKAVGHAFLNGDWPAEYARMRDSDQTFFVKTHDPPEDGGLAIYVVRNPRLAMLSFHQYLRDFDQSTLSLTDVILGAVPFGPWAFHLDAWQPQCRPATLMLRYEDLVSAPEPAIERLCEFSGLDAVGAWRNDFDELRRIDPRFFRKGKTNADDGAFNIKQEFLLHTIHGDWMAQLGYGGGEEWRIFDRPTLRAEMRRLGEAIKRGHDHYRMHLQMSERAYNAEVALNKARAELERLRAGGGDAKAA